MTANYLDDLAENLRSAAEKLERSSLRSHQAWAGHLRSDRAGILLLAGAWREPEPSSFAPSNEEPKTEVHRCSIAACGATGLGTWCSEPERAEVVG